MKNCIGCQNTLSVLDNDPNGDENATCCQCRAEEDHDFDAEPQAIFNRLGERTDVT